LLIIWLSESLGAPSKMRGFFAALRMTIETNNDNGKSNGNGNGRFLCYAAE
jgi:hypothetical protein